MLEHLGFLDGRRNRPEAESTALLDQLDNRADGIAAVGREVARLLQNAKVHADATSRPRALASENDADENTREFR